ncbi:MAG: CBS domain-containing protein [Planctomycetaceae bacterium]|nr:CBS domain-containing protein [Planctomycetota bacterium]NUN51302.1 CBS domain-containing protein [Planctomycetaceae bacterium]
MSIENDEDLDRYMEAGGVPDRVLNNRVLLRPISDLRYPRNPLAYAPGASVSEALSAMMAKNLGAVLVVDGGKVVGIFSERDALRKGLYVKGAGDRPIREFMTPNPDCLTPHDSIAFAMNRMGVGGYRHIPLVDAQRRPVGMLVMRDLVRYVVTFFPAEALNLPPHSEHAPPERNKEGG